MSSLVDIAANGFAERRSFGAIDRLTLTFRDRVLEAEFAREKYHRYLFVIRASLLLAVLLYAGFGLADIWVVPDIKETAWLIRYALVCPLLAGVLGLSFTRYFQRVHGPALGVLVMAAAGGIILIMALATPPGNHLYYVGLILIVIYCYHFLRLSFIYASALSWSIFALFALTSVVAQPLSIEILLSISLFFTTNVVCMVTGYTHELYGRKEFLQNKILEETDRRFANIAANVPGSVFRFVQHGDGSISVPYMSAGLRQTFGRDPTELAAHPARWLEWIHAEDRPIWRQELAAARSDLRPFEQEIRFVAADDSVKWMRTVARPHRAVGEDVIWDGINLDITDLKAREAELLQVQKMEAVGRLTGGIAHDFNNLLTVVKGNLQLLREDLEGQEDLTELVMAAEGATARGQDLTGRLLAFSRRQTLEPKAIELRRLIPDMERLLRRTLGESIEISTHLADELWEPLADAHQLENAILNLALNARDAMSGGGRLTLEAGNVQLDQSYSERHAEVAVGDYVMLAVSDTGSGMSPETTRRAFEPFFTTKPPGSGSGLGLSMVYGFVKQSRGHVQIYSELDLGTTIKLYLPRADESASRDGQDMDAPQVAAGNAERVLVVEDDPDVRTLASRLLTSLGYRVVTAADGKEALAALEHDPVVDLLFTDMIMPGGMSGAQLAEAAQSRRPGLKVLFTTGYTENSPLYDKFISSGTVLLHKPYAKQELAARVRQALSARESDAA